MRSVRAILIVGVLAVHIASAQAPPSFEVASIKQVAWESYDEKHQGIKVDGQIADFGNMSLADLAAYGFHAKTFQISAPKEMTARFNILAKMPDGAKPDQAPDMVVQLLVERFQMKFHKEDKEFPVYALIVGPKGAKLTPAPPDFNHADSPQLYAWTMDLYAQAISRHFDKPVINETGLPGKYLIGRVPFVTPQMRQSLARYLSTGDGASPAEAASEPPGSVITPILSNLGLKAVPVKRPLPAIVIDRIDIGGIRE
jgi:uncharacterized protein (TIGR03435 family)